MKNSRSILSVLAFCAIANAGFSQHVKLHANPRWEECSFQLDRSLTRDAWHRFTEEAGLVAYFRPLTDAKPIGAGKFEFALNQWETGIDPNTEAWNNTFVHPDTAHWLVENGKRLGFPGLSFKIGLSRRIDVGAYWTVNPGANYGFWAGQVQYNLVNDTVKKWAVSGRLSFSSLYGPADLDLKIYGLDVVASKQFRIYSDWVSLSPYVNVSTYLASSHEKSVEVNLKDENVLGMRGAIGAAANISIARLGIEYDIARVNSLCFKLGVAYRFKTKPHKTT